MADIALFGDDAFTAYSLTAAVNEQPATPSKLEKLGLFREEGIPTTMVSVERENSTLSLIPNQPRDGDPTDITGGNNRGLVHFGTSYLPTTATISPTDIQNVRAFGSVSELEMLEKKVMQRAAKMRSKADSTIEFQRLNAIKGVVLDSDGTSVLADIHGQFGIDKTKLVSPLQRGAKLRSSITAATHQIEDELGAASQTGFLVLCGKNVFDFLQEDAGFIKAYERYQDGQKLREDISAGVSFGGATWMQYRGKAGGVEFIDPNEAYMVPLDVADMFMTYFSPPAWTGFENTDGVRLYLQQEPKPMKKGVAMELVSAPISICTRPMAVRKLTLPTA